MDLEVLVSTMNLEDNKKLVESLNIKGKSLVINQCKQENKLEDITKGQNRLLNFLERGLSRSRNRALENAKADICVIADDDMVYDDEYEKNILEAHEKYPEADIIAFYVIDEDGTPRKKVRKEGKINLLTSLKLASVQLTFKRKRIIDSNVKFDEQFGAGAKLYMGEENIFLANCLKKKLKIYYVPKKIAMLKKCDSTWFEGYTDKFFEVKGTVFYKISKMFYPILILQFVLRKKKLYGKDNTPINALKCMFRGVKKYKKANKK